MKIIIPTHRRVEKQKTFSFLPESLHKDTVLIADEVDAPALRELLKDTEAKVVVHPPEIDSIAKKRAWIIQNSSEDKILMLDDDLRFEVQDKPDNTYLRRAEPEEVGKYIKQVEDYLDDYAHVGISARQGNNRLERPYRENSRMMYALGYRPEVLREHCELGRIEHREDFDYCLQLLKAGYPNIVLTYIAVGQDYNNAGGASEQRTTEASNQDAYKLAELHPGLVRTTEKDYKQSVKRIEVICQWRKAYDQSQKS